MIFNITILGTNGILCASLVSAGVTHTIRARAARFVFVIGRPASRISLARPCREAGWVRNEALSGRGSRIDLRGAGEGPLNNVNRNDQGL